MNIEKTLIVDVTTFKINPKLVLESEAKNNGKVIVTGVVQRANSKNANGRVYPKQLLMREQKKYTKERVESRTAIGELDHPESSVVSLKNGSHHINKLWWDGDDLLGEIEILTDLPNGRIVRDYLKAGITIGISSRGLGSVKTMKEDGTVQVEDDFEIITWDFVSNPSTQGAYMEQVKESKGSRLVSEGKNMNTLMKQEIEKTKKINYLINQILSK